MNMVNDAEKKIEEAAKTAKDKVEETADAINEKAKDVVKETETD